MTSFLLQTLKRDAQLDPTMLMDYVRALERTLGLHAPEPMACEPPEPGPVTEDDRETIKDWYKQAREGMHAEEFIEYLSKFEHDYGTIVHAMTAAALNAMWRLNATDQGGITGFQASCIAWEFWKRWMHLEGPSRLVKFDSMLYPQYNHQFDKTIPQRTFDWLQKKAAENLAESKGHVDVRAHWESIVDGVVPFGWTIKDED